MLWWRNNNRRYAVLNKGSEPRKDEKRGMFYEGSHEWLHRLHIWSAHTEFEAQDHTGVPAIYEHVRAEPHKLGELRVPGERWQGLRAEMVMKRWTSPSSAKQQGNCTNEACCWQEGR